MKNGHFTFTSHADFRWIGTILMCAAGYWTARVEYTRRRRGGSWGRRSLCGATCLHSRSERSATVSPLTSMSPSWPATTATEHLSTAKVNATMPLWHFWKLSVVGLVDAHAPLWQLGLIVRVEICLFIIIIFYTLGRYIWEKKIEKLTNRYDTQSAQSNAGKQSWSRTALKRCNNTEILWKRKTWACHHHHHHQYRTTLHSNLFRQLYSL